MRRLKLKGSIGFAVLLLWVGVVAALEPSYEQAPTLYSETEPVTPLTVIRDRIRNGEDLLSGKSSEEILVKLLKLLEVPVESQVLVYSKTSAQNSRISPDRPRAIYFSDNAYVGWVQFGNIEVVTFDEKLGMVFHLLDISSRDTVRFIRDRSCLNCHGGSSTRNWPGLLVRSVFPRDDGQPIFHAGTFRTDHSSPLSERWGGWYVTGSAGGQAHLGNIIAEEDTSTRKVSYQPVVVSAVDSLDGIFPTDPYPAGGVSDIVALMVLEHQLAVHNSLVEGNLVTRQTLHRHRKMKEAFGEPVTSPMSETNLRVIQSQADRIVGNLLFAEEHVMAETGVEGSDRFQKAFQANARSTADHRSLKDFRLYERLFKYRCSYLIYSDAFQHLPGELKSLVMAKLKAVLDGTAAVEYPHLSDTERERITDILTETLPAFSDK
ncbi:MAG: hypothetical protein P1U89_11775 [Verrucomicrobiales bacterium]|nr:hypothetical protein [Verrucomicrobiales bacterium]